MTAEAILFTLLHKCTQMMNARPEHCICIEIALNLQYIYCRRCTDMSSTIQVRVDDELKNKSDQLFKDLGTDTTSAIRMFLTQAVAVEGFPFEIKRVSNSSYWAMSEDELLERLRVSRESGEQGRLRPVADVLSDMRDKYGL